MRRMMQTMEDTGSLLFVPSRLTTRRRSGPKPEVKLCGELPENTFRSAWRTGTNKQLASKEFAGDCKMSLPEFHQSDF